MSFYTKPAKNIPLDSFDNIKKAIKEHWEEGKKIISHFQKMEEGYSDWEDRLIEIENAIVEYEDETGLSKEEVLKAPAKETKSGDFDLEDFLSE
jgi:ribulose 1,5-bisphosphate carboxylase large subunit-like protein